MRHFSHPVRLEALEHRSLFSYTFSQTGGTVTATGTIAADALVVSQTGSTVKFAVNSGSPFLFSNVTAININAAGGNDTVTINHTSAPVSASINVYIDAGSGNDTVSGGFGDETILGNDGLDNIDGNEGDDAIYGNADNDSLVGGDGNDSLFGGDGNDNLRGATGADALRGEAGSADVVDYQSSTGPVKITFDNVANDGTYSGGSEGDNVTTTNEIVQGSTYGDTIDASFVSYPVTLYGNGGNDLLSGGSGSDFIDGGTGTDTVISSGGSDSVINVP